MPSLRDFAKRMKRHGANVEKNATALVRKCALAIDGAVVMATPVDTGRARSNWQVSLNAPASGQIEAYAPGEAGSTGGANARAALDQGKETISKFDTPGGAIHITNNLPYIGRLNDGHSAQAPAGFVQTAVLVGVSAIKGAEGIVTGDFRDGQ
jgi:hypothetical protein